MVIPNFFITFVRHSFHTSHSLHIPSRERRHRPAPFLPPGATTPSWHTRCLTHTRTRLPHTLHLAKGYAHAPRTRYASSPSQHPRPPHTTTPAKGYATHTSHAQKCRNAFPCSPLLSEKKERASTTKILHITILHVTFTRIGVKTTQKSEAIFSFID